LLTVIGSPIFSLFKHLQIMKDFLEEMGVECPDFGWKTQVKILAQLLVMGAVVVLPLLGIMMLAGALQGYE
jgi:hypothetical protein